MDTALLDRLIACVEQGEALDLSPHPIGRGFTPDGIPIEEDLTRLAAAARDRTTPWKTSRTIPATIIRTLALSRDPRNPAQPITLHRRGIVIVGARITGTLDLYNIAVDVPIRLIGCRLEADDEKPGDRPPRAGAIRLDHTTLRTFALSASCVGHLTARSTTLAGNLRCEFTRFQGLVLVRNCTVNGNVFFESGIVLPDQAHSDHHLDQTAPPLPKDAVTHVINKAEADVAEDESLACFFFLGTHIRGEVNLNEARIFGAASFRSCTINNRFRAVKTYFQHRNRMLGALSLQGATIEGDVDLKRAIILGTLGLAGARIRGGISLVGADLSASTDMAIVGNNVSIGTVLDLRYVRADGSLHFRNAVICGHVFAHGAFMDGPRIHALKHKDQSVKGTALDLMLAVIEGDVKLGPENDDDVDLSIATDPELDKRVSEATFIGAVSLRKANIKGDLIIRKVDFRAFADRNFALRGTGMTVGGYVRMSNMTCRGGIRLVNARIANSLLINQSTIQTDPIDTNLRNAHYDPKFVAFSGAGLRVGRDVRMGPRLTLRGTLVLSDAIVRGNLVARQLRIDASFPTGIKAGPEPNKDLKPASGLQDRAFVAPRLRVRGSMRLRFWDLSDTGSDAPDPWPDETNRSELCGMLNLEEARIAGSLDLEGTHFTSKAVPSVWASQIQIGGDLRLGRGAVIRGCAFRNAEIGGMVDVRGSKIGYVNSELADQVFRMAGISLDLRRSTINGNVLGGFLDRAERTAGNPDQEYALFCGCVILTSTEIKGTVYLRGSEFYSVEAMNGNPDTEKNTSTNERGANQYNLLTIHAPDLTVNGSFDSYAPTHNVERFGSKIFRDKIQHTRFRGGINLARAHIGGSLVLSTAMIQCMQQVSQQRGHGLSSQDDHDQNTADVTSTSPGDFALFAPGLSVDGNVYFNYQFEAFGRMALPRANLGGNLQLISAAIFWYPQSYQDPKPNEYLTKLDTGEWGQINIPPRRTETRGTTLDLSNSTIKGDVRLAADTCGQTTALPTRICGQVDLSVASIAGDVAVKQCVLWNSDRQTAAFALTGATVRGNVSFEKTALIVGRLRVSNLDVGIDFQFYYPPCNKWPFFLKARAMRVEGTLFWNRAREENGENGQSAAHCRSLDVPDVFRPEDGEDGKAADTIDWAKYDETPRGVDLTEARVTILCDTRAGWPGQAKLETTWTCPWSSSDEAQNGQKPRSSSNEAQNCQKPRSSSNEAQNGQKPRSSSNEAQNGQKPLTVLRLDGFTYDRIAAPSPQSKTLRMDWLSRQEPDRREQASKRHFTENGHSDHTGASEPILPAQPIRQLINVLFADNKRAIAQDLDVERLRIENRTREYPARALYWLTDKVFLYGYGAVRASVIFLSFVILGLISFSVAEQPDFCAIRPAQPDYYQSFESYETALRDSAVRKRDTLAYWRVAGSDDTCPAFHPEYPAFRPLLYALDTFIPVVDLRQQSFWITVEVAEDPTPDPHAVPSVLSQPSEWAERNWVIAVDRFMIIMGWVLTTLAVVALTAQVQTRFSTDTLGDGDK